MSVPRGRAVAGGWGRLVLGEEWMELGLVVIYIYTHGCLEMGLMGLLLLGHVCAAI